MVDAARPAAGAEILLRGRGPADGAQRADRRESSPRRPAAIFGWGMFNVELAAGMLREAAAQAYGLVGEVIPSDVPGKLAMGVRQPAGVVRGDRALERARDPRHARAWPRRSPTATQSCSRPPSCARAPMPPSSRRSSTPGCPPGVLNLITNDPADAGRRRRRADRPPRGPPRSTSPARPRSDGSSPRTPGAISSACCSSWAARRRWSCSRDADLDRAVGGRQLRRLLSPGSDLHVDRADRRRPRDRRRSGRAARRRARAR